jgi:hypothetical protein
MTAIEDIAAERRRQVSEEGWTPAHDDEHHYGEMARAAACYALASVDSKPLCATLGANFAGMTVWGGQVALTTLLWPWAAKWWKPKDRRRDLVKAAALIVAEIERLDRIEAKAR